MLRTYSKMLTNRNHGNINFNMEMFENVWGFVKDKNFENNPSLGFTNRLFCLNDKDEKVCRSFLN
ncbi:MAG: hypothetical protein R2942_03645 [Ignavibacteria bacterium]